MYCAFLPRQVRIHYPGDPGECLILNPNRWDIVGYHICVDTGRMGQYKTGNQFINRGIVEECSCKVTEKMTDSGGSAAGLIRSFHTTIRKTCEQQCINDKYCEVFVWHHSDADHAPSWCFLHKKMTPLKRDWHADFGDCQEHLGCGMPKLQSCWAECGHKSGLCNACEAFDHRWLGACCKAEVVYQGSYSASFSKKYREYQFLTKTAILLELLMFSGWDGVRGWRGGWCVCAGWGWSGGRGWRGDR